MGCSTRMVHLHVGEHQTKRLGVLRQEIRASSVCGGTRRKQAESTLSRKKHYGSYAGQQQSSTFKNTFNGNVIARHADTVIMLRQPSCQTKSGGLHTHTHVCDCARRYIESQALLNRSQQGGQGASRHEGGSQGTCAGAVLDCEAQQHGRVHLRVEGSVSFSSGPGVRSPAWTHTPVGGSSFDFSLDTRQMRYQVGTCTGAVLDSKAQQQGHVHLRVRR